MDITDMPAYAIGLFGLIFLTGGILSPWVARATGLRSADDAERALLIVLGACLLSLWLIWRWVAGTP